MLLPMMLLAWPSAPARAAEPCRPDVLKASAVAETTEEGEVRLQDGRLLRLAGLESGPALVAALRAGLPPGATALFGGGGGAPDRWGRLAVQLYLPGEEGRAPDWAQGALVETGLARLRPEGLPAPCWAALLSFERRAREGKAGAWAEPDAIVEATDRAALARLAGRRGVVEGVVVGTGQGRSLLFLNFGGNRYEDFSVTISKRRAATLQKAGINAAALVGARVRLRGVLGRGRRPSMEIYAADEIERVE